MAETGALRGEREAAGVCGWRGGGQGKGGGARLARWRACVVPGRGLLL